MFPDGCGVDIKLNALIRHVADIGDEESCEVGACRLGNRIQEFRRLLLIKFEATGNAVIQESESKTKIRSGCLFPGHDGLKPCGPVTLIVVDFQIDRRRLDR